MAKLAPTISRQFSVLIKSIFVVSAFALTPAFAQNEQITQIRDLFFKGQFAQVIATSATLPAALRENSLVCFWLGQSYLRCHDIEHAEEYLRKAEEGQLGKAQFERAQTSLSRIRSIKELHPPFLHDYTLEGYTIKVFARDTPWSKGLAAQMPTFLNRAKEAYGSANAVVAFYLFEDRSSYNKFFEDWAPQSEGKTHRGTGGMHMVLFCKYYPTGKAVGEKDVNDLYFRVLHEYSHALCNTVYGDNFHMPQWLNEGMADYFGWKYKPNGAAEAAQRLKKLASEKSPRSYEEISTNLYEESDTGYATGDVMVTELMTGKPLSIYGQIISSARSSGGNFNSAIQQATGLDPRKIYSRLVSAYWKGDRAAQSKTAPQVGTPAK